MPAAPVVQTLLVADDTTQAAWVEWRVPPESAFGTGVRPVAAALVQLSLRIPGDSVTFVPAIGVPGRFDAPVTVVHGASYQLFGAVAAAAVAATTTVPGPLDVREPAADTVRLASGSCFGVCQVPYRWGAAGASAYLYVQTRLSEIVNSGSTADTAGVMSLSQTRPGADTTLLTIYALDANAAAYILPTTPRSSIAGVFGMFGSAAVARLVIIWQ
jgi:hypothetical protein